MQNPIFNELIKLKLISKLNLVTISNKTRDKNIKVIKDLKTKIIFLEKYLTSTQYYSLLKYKIDHIKYGKGRLLIKPKDYLIISTGVMTQIALNAATLPFVLKLAQDGYKNALASDANFLAGLNIWQGNITHKAVAEDLSLEFVDPSKAIN